MSRLFIGVMSGTSLDAIDCALVRFTNNNDMALIASHSMPYPQALRKRLLQICRNEPLPISSIGTLDTELGHHYAEAILQLLAKAKCDAKDISAIGNHGQTVYHQPTGQYTFSLQLGNPHVIAAKTQIPVVADFRRLDMAYGGQGAPLTPAFHARHFSQKGKNTIIVNIGGIANITVLAKDTSQIYGFDTGPGNVLMDAWINQHKHVAFDENGLWALSGKVDDQLLAQLLAEPYFQKAPPKSTGRELFNLDWLQKHLATSSQLKPEDVQATLLELTARSITAGILATTLPITGIYLCGGGAYNRALLQRLALLNPKSMVMTTMAFGIDPSWVEAMAFAEFAKLTLENKPSNLPIVTGASRHCILGVIYPP